MRVMVALVAASLFLYGCSDDEPASTSAADAAGASVSPSATGDDARAAASTDARGDVAATATTDGAAGSPTQSQAAAAQATDAGARASDAVAPANDEGARASGEAAVHDAVASRAAAGEYTIAPGDTLVAIAKAHGLDAKELAQWNGIEDPRRLQIGQRIRLSPPGG